MSSSVKNLRRLIQENIRIQRGTDAAIEYIDAPSVRVLCGRVGMQKLRAKSGPKARHISA